MKNKTMLAALVVSMLLAAVTACSSTTQNATQNAGQNTSPNTTQNQTGRPITGTVINSDSLITANIQAINKQASGYPWSVDILIQSSTDVNNLPNPTKTSIGKTVTVKTDQDMSTFHINDLITARVKDVGDVPQPGITLYMYSINITGR